MTWVESFNYCKLSTEKDVMLFNARYAAWGSGVYLNTKWMIHKGCYKSSDTVDSKNVQAIANNSPSLCSDQCEMSLHFALKFNWCLCLNSIHNMAKMTSDKCKYTCVGSKDDSCGDRIYYSVYSHVTENISSPYTTNRPKLVTTPVSRRQYKTRATEIILYPTRFRKAFQTSGIFVRETSTLSSIGALVTIVAFVIVCLLTYIIALLRKGRQTKQSSQYELSARTTPEPRMYSQLLMPSQGYTVLLVAMPLIIHYSRFKFNRRFSSEHCRKYETLLYDNAIPLHFIKGMEVSPNKMTWLKSFSYCSLASEDKIQSLNNGEFRGWVGGIYLNSQWMFHTEKYDNENEINRLENYPEKDDNLELVKKLNNNHHK
ncbi:unnamed protein product [Mytilus edulis]|uniref:WSC domain-containing protein n=1 Tax=Mytilus edulis TaxID=6550 RepID=A0A8S3SB59_MYTED|nr:unnamed protein product [Mytilus edulis]